jgi:hypothetical protein
VLSAAAGIDRLKGEYHAIRQDINEVSRVKLFPPGLLPLVLDIHPSLSPPSFCGTGPRDLVAASAHAQYPPNPSLQVFGGKDGRFRFDWFFPVPVKFPRSVASDILGYRLEVGRLGSCLYPREPGLLLSCVLKLDSFWIMRLWGAWSAERGG